MDHYELSDELAAGGYGAVYLCKNHPDLVIKVEVVARNPEQFYNEI